MPAELQVAVDASCWRNRRGYGRHARALLPALFAADRVNHYTFFLDAAEIPPGIAIPEQNLHFLDSSASSATDTRSPAAMWRMSRALSNAPADVVLFPSVYTFVPVLSKARKIVFLHDVIADRYPHLALHSAQARLFWKLKVACALRQADAVVTVSEYARRTLIEHFRLRPDRVFACGEAPDPCFRPLPPEVSRAALTRYGLDQNEELIVYAGGFGPHKNVPALVRAFAASTAQGRLALIGDHQTDSFYCDLASIRQAIRETGSAARVTWTGFIPDEDLAAFYNAARVVVLPSLMEGYGLPAVEAAACGAPVIATRESPLPEILRGGGIFVDPNDPIALRDALQRVLSSERLRTEMSHAGQAAVAELSWNQAARELIQVVEQVTSWTGRSSVLA